VVDLDGMTLLLDNYELSVVNRTAGHGSYLQFYMFQELWAFCQQNCNWESDGWFYMCVRSTGDLSDTWSMFLSQQKLTARALNASDYFL